MKNLAIVSIGLLVAVGFSACGGVNKNATLTKSELVAKADSKCKAVISESKALEKQVKEAVKEENGDSNAAFKKLSPKFEAFTGRAVRRINELKGLKPPQRIARAYNRWLSVADRQLVIYRKLIKTVKNGSDPTALAEKYAAGTVKLKSASRELKKSGFKQCPQVLEIVDEADGSAIQPEVDNFVSAADQICEASNARSAKFGREFQEAVARLRAKANGSSPREVKKLLKALAPKLRSAFDAAIADLRKLERLTPTTAVATDWNKYISAQRDLEESTDGLVRAFETGNIAAVGQGIDPDLSQRATAAAEALKKHGLKNCTS